MTDFDDLLDSLPNDQVRAIGARVGKELRDRIGAGNDAHGVDWGSISDAELEVRKRHLFRTTVEAAHKKRIDAEHDRLDSDAELLDALNKADYVE